MTQRRPKQQPYGLLPPGFVSRWQASSTKRTNAWKLSISVWSTFWRRWRNSIFWDWKDWSVYMVGSRCGEDPDAEEAMLYTCRSLLLTMSRQTRKSMSLSTMDHHVSWYMLYICGGFYDGYKPVVELLSKPVSMIPDLTRTRHVEVATLLWALVMGMACLRQWVHHEIMFRPLLLINRRLVSRPPEPSKIRFSPCTSRMYGTCELIGKQKDETGTLTSSPS